MGRLTQFPLLDFLLTELVEDHTEIGDPACEGRRLGE